MLNILLEEKELAVKVGDTVAVEGNRGKVTEVIKGKIDTGEDYTNVRVHFTGELANWGQYQDGVYGCFTVIEEER